jgi:CRISPR/Cas system Type II protein with McrA/HNH and RuvC-like nuclease domain
MGSMSQLSWRRKQRLWHAQNGRCAYCFQPLEFDPLQRLNAPSAPTEDHVFPRSRYKGIHRNRVLVHRRPCNEGKEDRDPTGCEILALAWVWLRMEALFGPGCDRDEPQALGMTDNAQGDGRQNG